MGQSSKDKRDIFYRLAKQEGWRARSAFKLLQIDDEFHILKGVKRAIDLCAAPGSWSQVLSRTLDNDATIVSVDLQAIRPIDRVISLQLDITHEKSIDIILDAFGNQKADLVICDGAPDVTGMHDLDEFLQYQLVFAALSLARRTLVDNGTFISKVFRGRDSEFLYSSLRRFFKSVVIAKPRSSRASSIEAFVVCQGFDENLELSNSQEKVDIQFVACGDLSGFDAEATYEMEGESLGPVEPPINTPYTEAIRKRRNLAQAASSESS